MNTSAGALARHRFRHPLPALARAVRAPSRAGAFPGGLLPRLALCGAALLPVVLVSALARATGLPLETFTKDPATVGGMNPLSGLLTNLGVLAWTAAAAVCLFAADRRRAAGQGRLAAFFLAGGVLTAVLLVDDLFMVHEYWGPRYLGVPEEAICAVYGVAGLAWLAAYRAEAMRHAPALLALALALFAVSVAGDVLFPAADRTLPLEDGAKWLGIVGWAAWWWTAARGADEGRSPVGKSPAETIRTS